MKSLLFKVSVLMLTMSLFSCEKTATGPAGANGTNGTNAVQSSQTYTVTPSQWTNTGGGGKIVEYNSQITNTSDILTYYSSDNVNWLTWNNYSFKTDSVTIMEAPIPASTLYFRVVILN
jgi:hypothetical protein